MRLLHAGVDKVFSSAATRGLLVGLRIPPLSVTLNEATDAIGILTDASMTVEGVASEKRAE
jgi:hypothetical protein